MSLDVRIADERAVMGVSNCCDGRGARSLRVVLGGTMMVVAAVVGMFHATPQYHRALTMQSYPQDLTWSDVARHGLMGNTFVKLSDVRLAPTDASSEQPGTGATRDRRGSVDDLGRDRQAMRQKLKQAIADADLGKFLATLLEPVKIIPVGSDPDEFLPTIIMDRCPLQMAQASKQLAVEGRLLGHLSRDRSSQLVTQLARSAQLDVSALSLPHRPVWHFQPLSKPTAPRQAAIWFWGCVVTYAAALVWCGSGSPSLAVGLLCWPPALISLAGFPLRYGRGGRGTRLGYTLTGILLIVAGGWTALEMGQFGRTESVRVLHPIGFLLASTGFAACLGAFVNLRAQPPSSLIASAGNQPSREAKRRLAAVPDPDGNATNRLGAEFMSASEKNLKRFSFKSCDIRRYVDPQILVVPDGTPPMMEPVTTQLTESEFEEPLAFEVIGFAHHCLTTIQIGCQSVVAAIVESAKDDAGNLGVPVVRLASILNDGFVVTTWSSRSDVPDEPVGGKSGLHWRCHSDDLPRMLTEHLNRTVTTAEGREVSVALLESGEWRDLFQYTNRVIADIRQRHSDDTISVIEVDYGRFQFPATPVRPLAQPAVI